jgi:hypothetical protein
MVITDTLYRKQQNGHKKSRVIKEKSDNMKNKQRNYQKV